jgi:hypothetical protein
MSEAIGQPGKAALPGPLGSGEILSRRPATGWWWRPHHGRWGSRACWPRWPASCMYLVLTEAITRAVAAADYRSGGHDDHSREARLCVR